MTTSLTSQKKDMKKILDNFIAGRKSGFTVVCQSQNYTSIPKTIVRNIHYFFLFRLNDNVSINNIIRNHNTDNVDKETFKKLYLDATAEPLNFFMLDLGGKHETRLRKFQTALHSAKFDGLYNWWLWSWKNKRHS